MLEKLNQPNGHGSEVEQPLGKFKFLVAALEYGFRQYPVMR